jgi:hypothetical protein
VEQSRKRITPGVIVAGATTLVAAPALVGSWVALVSQQRTIQNPVTTILSLCLMIALTARGKTPSEPW